MLDSKLFDGLDKEEYKAFIAFAAPIKKKLLCDEVLCDEGMLVHNFAVLTSGRLKSAKYRFDGTLDIIEIYTKNDIINLEAVSTPTKLSPVQISAMEDSELFLFDHAIIDSANLSRNGFYKIQQNIIQILANENIKKLYKIDVLYKKALRDRILVFLKILSTRLGRDEFHIRMDREQFAQYLGVNRSALSHELSKMRKEGIIDFRKDYFKLLEPNFGKK